jgi:hypothetical protein
MSEPAKPTQTAANASSSLGKDYVLAPLVFACPTRHGVVFLDLRRNRYLGLDSSAALILSRLVRSLPQRPEWRETDSEQADDPTIAGDSSRYGVVLLDPRRNRQSGSESSAAEREEVNEPTIAGRLLQSMLKEGLLARDAAVASDLVSTEIDLKCALVSIGDEVTLAARVRMRDVAAFAFFLTTAAIALRCLPLRWIVRRAHARRTRAYRRGYRLDVGAVARHVSTFRAIRPHFFVAKDHALLHALTLIDYLAHYGEFPVWVFGVATEPWATHTWLQYENYLVDGNPEAVCRLEPILAV